jgi:hypothetical protein
MKEFIAKADVANLYFEIDFIKATDRVIKELIVGL